MWSGTFMHIHVSRRLCRPRTRGPGQSYVAHKKRSWFTRDRLPLPSLRPCPRRPAQALSDPGKPFSRQLAVGARFLLRQQRPGGARRWPAAASFRGLIASASPVPRRFAHRTTDMAPMLRHADPCRASPCRPRCLLSALNRARPRSRAPSSPVRRLPKRSRLRACPDSSPRLPSSCRSAIFSFKPCCSGVQGGRRQQRKLPDVGSALRRCNAELRDREAPSAAARLRTCQPLPFPGLHGDERRAGRGFGARVRRVVHA